MIFAFSNQKGGVGKTTTVLNLGACLAEMGHKILLIDLDPQANLTSGLGLKKDSFNLKGSLSIYNILLENKNFSNVFKATKIKNLFLIPSSIDLAGAEIELVNKLSRESILKNAISSEISNYDFIFIDCPPSLGILTINALIACDRVIVPIQCEYFALEGLSQLGKTIDLVKSINTGLQIGGVILTMFDARTKLSKSVEKEVKGFFKEKVFETVIPRNVKLSESPSFGKPISLYDKNAQGYISYKSLADEFAKRFS